MRKNRRKFIILPKSNDIKYYCAPNLYNRLVPSDQNHSQTQRNALIKTFTSISITFNERSNLLRWLRKYFTERTAPYKASIKMIYISKLLERTNSARIYILHVQSTGREFHFSRDVYFYSIAVRILRVYPSIMKNSRESCRNYSRKKFLLPQSELTFLRSPSSRLRLQMRRGKS